MCLILVAVEKYPFTDQRHFTSGAHWKGRECDTAKARRPSHFAFPQRAAQVTGHLRSPNQSLESVMLLHQAARTDNCPFSLPALLSLWRAGRPDHLPGQADSRRLLMTLKAGTEKSFFSSPMSKNNRIQRISLHGVGTWHHTCFCLHWKQATLCIIPLWLKSMPGKTSGTGFTVLTGGGKTEQALSAAGWRSARWQGPSTVTHMAHPQPSWPLQAPPCWQLYTLSSNWQGEWFHISFVLISLWKFFLVKVGRGHCKISKSSQWHHTWKNWIGKKLLI